MRQCVAAVVALWIVSGSASMQALRTLEIYSIDVEGGQATLFVTPSGESLLVDAGNPGERDAGRIAEVARHAGVSQIDYLVITHYDGDHVGGVRDLVARMPIKHFVDHGTRTNPVGAPPLTAQRQANVERADAAYAEARAAGDHVVVQAGDKIPIKGLDVQVVSSNGKVITHALTRNGARNALCGGYAAHPVDTTENINSVGMLLVFGRFRMLDLGDLTWNTEHELVCPRNLLGVVDVYLTTHHGLARSGPPVLVQAIAPRVVLMNNGPRKGGSVETWEALRKTKSIEDIWQQHLSIKRSASGNFEERADPGGPEYNAAESFIANLDEAPPAHTPAYGLHVSVRPDGSFTVINTRNNFSKAYQSGARR